MLSILTTGEVMAAQKTNMPGTELDEVLNRLTDRDIPAAVGFDARMRTLISIASLTAAGDTQVLRKIVADGIQNGINPLEMREAIV